MGFIQSQLTLGKGGYSLDNKSIWLHISVQFICMFSCICVCVSLQIFASLLVWGAHQSLWGCETSVTLSFFLSKNDFATFPNSCELMLCYEFRIACWLSSGPSWYNTMSMYGLIPNFRRASGHIIRQKDYFLTFWPFLSIKLIWTCSFTESGETIFVLICFAVTPPSDFSFNDKVSEQVHESAEE